MASNYLDDTGLAYLWGKIKGWVNSSNANVVHRTGDETLEGVKIFQNTAEGHTAGETVTDLVIRNPEVDRGTPVEGGRSYTRVILADAEGDTEETFAGRLGLLEVVSPQEDDTIGEELRLGCYKYSGNSADYSKYAGFRAGYDLDGIPFSTAPATSDDRTNSTDIVTRGYMEASEWNWQKSKKAGAVTFKSVPESDLEPVVDFMFAETPPASGERGPSNPSTIAGVSSIGLARASKNAFYLNGLPSSQAGVTISVDDEGIITLNGTVSGTLDARNWVWSSTPAIRRPRLSGQYLFMKVEVISGTLTTAGTKDYVYAEMPELNIDTGATNYRHTNSNISGDTVYPIASIQTLGRPSFSIFGGQTFTNYKFKIMFEVSDSNAMSAYEPAHTTFTSIALGDTYYGGSLDVATGVMTVTWVGGLVPVKGFTYHADGIVGFQWDLGGNPRFTGGLNTDTDITCTHFINSTDVSQYPENIRLSGPTDGTAWGGFISINESRIGGSGLTNAQYLSNMQQYITNNNVMFAAKIYTPFTVQLTPTQIHSLPALDKYEPRINTVYIDQEAVQIGYQRYANYVDLTTDQTISGTKTFTSDTKISKSYPVFSLVSTSGNWSDLYFQVLDANAQSGFKTLTVLRSETSETGTFQISRRFNGGSDAWSGPSVNLDGNSGDFYLEAQNATQSIILRGKPDGTLTWDGQPIQTTSDERLKTPLSEVPDVVLDAWEEVNWGQFKYLDAVKEKGESARLHLGLIAQHVMSVFGKHGLDACDYGILCHEEHEATEDSEAVDLWMVRYAEAQAMETCCMRRENTRLKKRVADLEERLEALELLLKS